jgi:UDP-N-acetylmuramyl pentapeptide synthase
MKEFFKRIVIFTISSLAHIQYLISKPLVIGITGSVGKTSTREAIYMLLYSVYGDSAIQAQKNYNGDIGLPLTFLQKKTGFSNPIEWFKIIFTSINEIFISLIKKNRGNSNYPKYIVAEYGVDHPGEMDDQLKVALPDIAVVTKIALVHTQEFGSINNIVTEKGKIIKCLSKESIAILNYDDVNVRKLGKNTRAKRIFFGRQQKGVDIGFSGLKETTNGIELNIHDSVNRKKEKLTIKILGSYGAYIILPAIAIGIQFGRPLKEIVGILKEYKPPKGRMRILPGIINSIIIDGSYNASPVTMSAAIQTSRIFKKMNRILFLGDMRELGKLESDEHKKIAKLIKKYGNYAVLVGPLMERYTKVELLKLGYPPDRIFTTLDSTEAGRYISKIIKSSKDRTVVICKGSQNNIRLEKGIKLFFDPKGNAHNELTRQDDQWIDRS